MTVAQLADQANIGGRLVCAGDIVAIHGHPRAAVWIWDERSSRRIQVHGWRVVGFDGDTIHVYGARLPGRAPALRAFPADSVRPRRRR